MFEHASCQTSDGIRSLLAGLEPGMTEAEAVRLLGWNGMPLSCHLMLTAGPRAALGLLSPADRPIGRGEPFTTAFGIWGALTCRAGWVVEDADELPDGIARLRRPARRAVLRGRRRVVRGPPRRTGRRRRCRRSSTAGWATRSSASASTRATSCTSTSGSTRRSGAAPTVELRSGMAMQVDIIPATGTPCFTTNIEDGIALADDALRASFAAAYPDAWARIGARRAFMADALGIELHPDVLPLSNLAACLPPFLLRPDRALALTA